LRGIITDYLVILIGDCRVGKTSLLNRVIGKDKTSSRHYPPTIGVEYATTIMRLPNSNKELKIQIWDTCISVINS
jgi:GTPase SAR1 family protein